MDGLSERIEASRFRGDTDLLASMKQDEQIGPHLNGSQALRRERSMRARLLAHAVHLDLLSIRDIGRSIEHLKQRAGIDTPLEAYVFQEPAINAFVTHGRTRMFVGLSSGAINRLSGPEIQFVVGHELGHAAHGHLDVPAQRLVASRSLDPRSNMRLMAWQRAAEISADRAGLVCCGSIEVAVMAMFKMLSGLDLPDLQVDPARFAAQWDHLEQEVLELGDGDHWEATHPFPPLRVKAMIAFWESGFFEDAGDSPRWQQAEIDGQVSRLLALMDPLARESSSSADPLLGDFFLWGGLYVAQANGAVQIDELQRIRAISPPKAFDEAVASPPSRDECLEAFTRCVQRRGKLKALEIRRILEGIVHVAMVHEEVDAAETNAVKTLAERLGIESHACDLVIEDIAEGGT